MLAYHGTKYSNATSILKNGFFLKTYDVNSEEKQSMPGDLGAGIYAFICDKKLKNSINFARKRFAPHHCTLILELIENYPVLDLQDPKNIEYISRFRESLDLKRIEERAKKDKGKRTVTLDGYIIELLIAESEKRNPNNKIAAVRAPSYTKFEKGINFHASKIPNGIELCIRQKSIIKNIKLVKP